MNPGLREVDLKPSPKRASDKINMLKKGRKTEEENKSYRTAWTHIWIPAIREVDMETSVKRGGNTPEALVSLYLPSRSLHTIEPRNPISQKINQASHYQIVSNLKKVYPNLQILCSLAYENIIYQEYKVK